MQLVYNYFRDYDPSTGRYIQSDPIGLAAGVNTYAYVGANPINYMDRFGLSRCACNGKTYGTPEEDHANAVANSTRLGNDAVDRNASRANGHGLMTTIGAAGVSVLAPPVRLLQFGMGLATWGATAASGPVSLYPNDRHFRFLDNHGDHSEVIEGYLDPNGNIKEIHHTEAGRCE